MAVGGISDRDEGCLISSWGGDDEFSFMPRRSRLSELRRM